MQTVHFTGRSEEDAVRKAAEELNINESEVQYKIVSRSGGLLGLLGQVVTIEVTLGEREPKAKEPTPRGEATPLQQAMHQSQPPGNRGPVGKDYPPLGEVKPEDEDPEIARLRKLELERERSVAKMYSEKGRPCPDRRDRGPRRDRPGHEGGRGRGFESPRGDKARLEQGGRGHRDGRHRPRDWERRGSRGRSEDVERVGRRGRAEGSRGEQGGGHGRSSERVRRESERDRFRDHERVRKEERRFDLEDARREGDSYDEEVETRVVDQEVFNQKLEKAREVMTEIWRLLGGDTAPQVVRKEAEIHVLLAGSLPDWLTKGRNRAREALQFVVNKIVNRFPPRYRVVISLEGVWEERLQHLEAAAVALARKVMETGEPMWLMPMSPKERRIVHVAVSSIPGLLTRSVGDGPNRKLCIYKSVFPGPLSHDSPEAE